MGRATIISGGTGGEYQITLNLHRDRVEAELASLAGRITALADYIATLAAGPAKNSAILRKVALEKRVQYLNENMPADPVVSAWCADLTEDLTGAVGTIEVPGERAGVPVLIKPGFQGAAAYNQIEDGQLQPCLGGTPASVFYNLAMMPGWQKWRPTYRLGEMTAKDGDICSVAIDPASFSDRGSGLSPNLNINQDTADGLVTLDNVPIEYMTCNGVAFEVGDRVVVKFTDQDWSKPVVIGFEDNPEPCGVGILAIRVLGKYYEGSYPTNTATTERSKYLIWDTGTSSPLQLKKTGGGFWENPITISDYSGDWWDDFKITFGASSSKSTMANRYPVVPYVSGMSTGAGSGGFRSGGVQIIEDQLTRLARTEGHIYIKSYLQPIEAADAECLAYLASLNEPDLSPYSEDQPGGSVLNDAGSYDTWVSDLDALYTEQYDFIPGLFEYQSDADPPYRPGGFDAPGYATFSRVGAGQLSFNAPVGGVPDSNWYLGYRPASSSKVPPPAVSVTKGLGDIVFGPGITYSGSNTYTETFLCESAASYAHDQTCTFSNSQSGTGTFTFLSGSSVAISASFSESGQVIQLDSDPDSFEWPAYNPLKVVDYAISDIGVGQGYDIDENIQLMIVLETQESGHVEATMSPPDEPWFDYQPPVEDPAVVTGQVLDYYLASVKCSTVDNALSDDPWDLDENSELKTGIYSLIAGFLADNPVSSGDRWVLEPEVEILKW